LLRCSAGLWNVTRSASRSRARTAAGCAITLAATR
jgi:hypothetical protein